MTGRLKFFAAAALGLVLATGTLADVSAKTAAHQTREAHVAASHHGKIATKGHRLHVAHLRHARKLHVANRKAGHHLAKAHALKTTKEAGVTKTHREHQAMNHRAAAKRASVIR